MNLKKSNPRTPTQRNFIKINRKLFNLEKTPKIKSLIYGLKNSSGRNNLGKITSYHKGGGHKQKYRKINFYRVANSIGIVTSLEYDPNRTSNIAAVYNYIENSYFYILAPKNLKVGDIIKSGLNADPKTGHSLPISKIPVGSFIHNVSPKRKKKAQISRAAGCFSILTEKTSKFGRIKINSGEQRFLSINCYATIGIVSNEFLSLTTKGKAGRNRWLNKRPIIRGVAMNPIDHPHGGGEGKTSGGRTSVTPWGKSTKGGRTSKSTNKLILSRNKNG